jgi:hypothetical protein
VEYCSLNQAPVNVGLALLVVLDLGMMVSTGSADGYSQVQQRRYPQVGQGVARPYECGKPADGVDKLMRVRG